MATLESLVFDLKLNNNQYKKAINEINKQIISPRVDTRELHDLNKLLDLKVKHHKEVQAYFKNNPLTILQNNSAYRVLESVSGKKLTVELQSSKEVRDGFTVARSIGVAQSGQLDTMIGLLEEIRNESRKTAGNKSNPAKKLANELIDIKIEDQVSGVVKSIKERGKFSISTGGSVEKKDRGSTAIGKKFRAGLKSFTGFKNEIEDALNSATEETKSLVSNVVSIADHVKNKASELGDDLADLFAQVDEIGNKYQTPEEIEDFQKRLSGDVVDLSSKKVSSLADRKMEKGDIAGSLQQTFLEIDQMIEEVVSGAEPAAEDLGDTIIDELAALRDAVKEEIESSPKVLGQVGDIGKKGNVISLVPRGEEIITDLATSIEQTGKDIQAVEDTAKSMGSSAMDAFLRAYKSKLEKDNIWAYIEQTLEDGEAEILSQSLSKQVNLKSLAKRFEEEGTNLFANGEFTGKGNTLINNILESLYREPVESKATSAMDALLKAYKSKLKNSGILQYRVETLEEGESEILSQSLGKHVNLESLAKRFEKEGADLFANREFTTRGIAQILGIIERIDSNMEDESATVETVKEGMDAFIDAFASRSKDADLSETIAEAFEEGMPNEMDIIDIAEAIVYPLVSDLGDQLTEELDSIFDGLKQEDIFAGGMFDEDLDSAKKSLTEKIDSLVKGFSFYISEQTEGFISELLPATKINEEGGALLAHELNRISGGMEAIVQTFMQSTSKDFAEMGFTLAKSIGDGLEEGIEKTTADDIGVKAAEELIDGFKGKDGIDAHSPSKKFIAIGEMIVDGLAIGMEGVRDVVNSPFLTIATSISNSFNEIADTIETLFGPLIELSKEAIDISIAFESINMTLKYAAGGAYSAAKQFQFLSEMTTELGIDLQSSAESYAKFAAAVKGKIPTTEIQDLFTQVSKAGVIFGLTEEELQGSFVALQQIAAKQIVSMEELRQQLGEKLPVAMAASAKGMGMTEAKMVKLISLGQVDYKPFFRGFAEGLRDINENADIETTAQELARVRNQIELSKKALGDMLKPAYVLGLKSITGALSALGKFGKMMIPAGVFLGIKMIVGQIKTLKFLWGKLKEFPPIQQMLLGAGDKKLGGLTKMREQLESTEKWRSQLEKERLARQAQLVSHGKNIQLSRELAQEKANSLQRVQFLRNQQNNAASILIKEELALQKRKLQLRLDLSRQEQAMLAREEYRKEQIYRSQPLSVDRSLDRTREREAFRRKQAKYADEQTKLESRIEQIKSRSSTPPLLVGASNKYKDLSKSLALEEKNLRSIVKKSVALKAEAVAIQASSLANKGRTFAMQVQGAMIDMLAVKEKKALIAQIEADMYSKGFGTMEDGERIKRLQVEIALLEAKTAALGGVTKATAFMGTVAMSIGATMKKAMMGLAGFLTSPMMLLTIAATALFKFKEVNDKFKAPMKEVEEQMVEARRRSDELRESLAKLRDEMANGGKPNAPKVDAEQMKVIEERSKKNKEELEKQVGFWDQLFYVDKTGVAPLAPTSNTIVSESEIKDMQVFTGGANAEEVYKTSTGKAKDAFVKGNIDAEEKALEDLQEEREKLVADYEKTIKPIPILGGDLLNPDQEVKNNEAIAQGEKLISNLESQIMTLKDKQALSADVTSVLNMQKEIDLTEQIIAKTKEEVSARQSVAVSLERTIQARTDALSAIDAEVLAQQKLNAELLGAGKITQEQADILNAGLDLKANEDRLKAQEKAYKKLAFLAKDAAIAIQKMPEGEERNKQQEILDSYKEAGQEIASLELEQAQKTFEIKQQSYEKQIDDLENFLDDEQKTRESKYRQLELDLERHIMNMRMTPEQAAIAEAKARAQKNQAEINDRQAQIKKLEAMKVDGGIRVRKIEKGVIKSDRIIKDKATIEAHEAKIADEKSKIVDLEKENIGITKDMPRLKSALLTSEIDAMKQANDLDQAIRLRSLQQQFTDGKITAEQLEDAKIAITKQGIKSQQNLLQREMKGQANILAQHPYDQEAKKRIEAIKLELVNLDTQFLETTTSDRRLEQLTKRYSDTLDKMGLRAKELDVEVQKAVNAGVISKKEADSLLLTSSADRIAKELKLEQARMKELEALEKSNPALDTESELRASREKTLDLTLELLNKEAEARQAILDQISRTAEIEGQRADIQGKAIAVYDRIAQSQISLLEARNGLAEALNTLQEKRIEGAIEELQLSTQREMSDERRESIQRRVAKMESKLASTRIANLARVQQQERLSLEIEERKSLLESKRSEIEAKRSIIEAQRSLMEAQLEGDTAGVMFAQQSLGLALQEMEIVNQERRDLMEINALKQEQLMATQEIAREEFAREEIAKRMAKAEGEAVDSRKALLDKVSSPMEDKVSKGNQAAIAASVEREMRRAMGSQPTIKSPGDRLASLTATSMGQVKDLMKGIKSIPVNEIVAKGFSSIESQIDKVIQKLSAIEKIPAAPVINPTFNNTFQKGEDKVLLDRMRRQTLIDITNIVAGAIK